MSESCGAPVQSLRVSCAASSLSVTAAPADALQDARALQHSSTAEPHTLMRACRACVLGAQHGTVARALCECGRLCFVPPGKACLLDQSDSQLAAMAKSKSGKGSIKALMAATGKTRKQITEEAKQFRREAKKEARKAAKAGGVLPAPVPIWPGKCTGVWQGSHWL